MIPREDKLLDMLSNNDVTFYIPPYQRNYEWTADQCRVFFDDVKKTCDMNRNGDATEHFFGAITFFKNENDSAFGPKKLVLIDGQQRITTTMLFLAALRDVIGNEEIKDHINSHFLINQNVKDNEDSKIKLKQVEADWDSYREIIFGGEEGSKSKNSAVYQNYNFFYEKLAGFKNDETYLSDLVSLGLQKFSVISIELKPEINNWENPQEIFESMNSLGKPLSLADLVRNYLMLGMSAKDQDKYYSSYWLPIEKELSGLLSFYIRDFMQVQEEAPVKGAKESNYKELYSLFKSIFNDKPKGQVLKDLASAARVYAVVIGRRPCENETIEHILRDLRDFRVTTAYSFLMGLLQAWERDKFSNQDIVEILKAFRIYCLRRRLILAGKAENKIFPTLVGRIDELAAAPDKGAKLFEILATQESNLRVPNDSELRRSLELDNFGHSQYCRLFLAIIEEHLTKSRPDLKNKKLQVEHIMPQTLNDQWQAELGADVEKHQELVHTIGNLTLIRHNQELGNKPFADKKEIYENHSGLQIAKTMIIENERWNAETIRRRTDWLIKLLLNEILPIPDEMRKKNNFSVKQQRRFSFDALGLVGKEIRFIADPRFTVKVADDAHVLFEGKKIRLSPLTRELFERLGRANQSGAYQGAQYWQYDGKKLAVLLWGD